MSARLERVLAALDGRLESAGKDTAPPPWCVRCQARRCTPGSGSSWCEYCHPVYPMFGPPRPLGLRRVSSPVEMTPEEQAAQLAAAAEKIAAWFTATWPTVISTLTRIANEISAAFAGVDLPDLDPSTADPPAPDVLDDEP